MKAQKILDLVGEKLNLLLAALPDGGFIAGSGQDTVKGILLTWMATTPALREAVKLQANLVICHEAFEFYEMPQSHPYRWTSPPDEKPAERADHPNRTRKKFLEDHRLTLLMIHFGLDRLCIYDDFAQLAGLGKPVAGGGYETVFQLPQPLTVRQLAQNIARNFDFPHLRIVGPLERLVSKAGNLWGGVALSSNRYWMRKQIEFGAEVLVCGEANEESMFFAQEYNIPMIITGHAVSENPGLKRFAALLQAAFPAIPVHFYEVATPFVDLADQ